MSSTFCGNEMVLHTDNAQNVFFSIPKNRNNKNSQNKIINPFMTSLNLFVQKQHVIAIVWPISFYSIETKHGI